MFFTLGALTAGLLALLVLPAYARRAARLARRDIEARLPMTLEEFSAQKDALRAVHAASTARLERKATDLGDRLVEARILAERTGGEAAALRARNADLVAQVGETESRAQRLREDLDQREASLRELRDRLGLAESAIEARIARALRSPAQAASPEPLRFGPAAIRPEHSRDPRADDDRNALSDLAIARIADDLRLVALDDDGEPDPEVMREARISAAVAVNRANDMRLEALAGKLRAIRQVHAETLPALAEGATGRADGGGAAAAGGAAAPGPALSLAPPASVLPTAQIPTTMSPVPAALPAAGGTPSAAAAKPA
ncbi:hypothetical protein [Methylobrevis pamukkalensis]|uniref:Uncharacterized protein n=1 Tax=Methylobrevis pamukkalensis TaxID=1439726 RepID=A0A1E3GXU0_9HYPH|nr:hypothetical protein [Methylobrevis pamukkalensis]ODN68862.1 hypothetical protein A6302_03841 [Methylobrevis pamukkalensis]